MMMKEGIIEVIQKELRDRGKDDNNNEAIRSKVIVYLLGEDNINKYVMR